MRQKIILNLELADHAVEFSHFGLMVDFFLFALAKDVRSILDQILLPTGDLGRVFDNFIATMERSDFSCSCIIGFGSSPSRRGPSYGDGQAGDLPVPKQEAYAHARVSDLAGPCRNSQ